MSSPTSPEQPTRAKPTFKTLPLDLLAAVVECLDTKTAYRMAGPVTAGELADLNHNLGRRSVYEDAKAELDTRRREG
jgi:hypothetical protein